MRLRVLPYKMNSISSRAISKHFDNCLRIYPDGNFIPRNDDVIINWGTSGYIPVLNRGQKGYRLLNHPNAIENASNKINTLNILKFNNVPHVEFAHNVKDAADFIRDGFIVYCRTIIQGKEGKGIVLAKYIKDLPENCRLFTKHFKNDKEFRVHVFNGEIIDIVEKQTMSKERMIELKVKEEDLSDMIRNRKKGWSFNRDGIVIPDNIKQIAINATNALELDFAAVDLAHNTETGESVVLELNTAPGQTKGSDTHYRYTNAIERFLKIRITTKEEYQLKYGKKLKCNLFNE